MFDLIIYITVGLGLAGIMLSIYILAKKKDVDIRNTLKSQGTLFYKVEAELYNDLLPAAEEKLYADLVKNPPKKVVDKVISKINLEMQIEILQYFFEKLEQKEGREEIRKRFNKNHNEELSNAFFEGWVYGISRILADKQTEKKIDENPTNQTMKKTSGA